MSPQSDDQKKEWSITGVAIPAGLFIGMGVGFLVDNVTAGIFLGLGGGFLAMMIGMLILRIISGE
ncbi:unnamed protein product [marine sediment metagenome]|uniref:Uncharacterized protein n=1 Tax=marine sediment metagenome TaxID=412755 RepID=X0XV92_9ZZZZ